MHRVGGQDEEGEYEELGRRIKQMIVEWMPEEWTFEGKQVLDFGCGAGRVLRHFLTEAERGTELWGSEIDAASVEWLERHLSPPVKVVLHGERPPIPVEDGHFDLIYAMSVFTHITFEWSAWMLEMHRLLAEGGLLLATFLSEGMGVHLHEPWDEDRIGMNVARCGAGWDEGGPLTFISPWWLREHWGRAFEVLRLEPAVREIGDPWSAHGVVLLRRKPVTVTREELERVDPADPREIRALKHNVFQLGRELERGRRTQSRNEGAERQAAEAERWHRTAEWWEAQSDRLESQLKRQRRTVDEMRRSWSWRMTAPLRKARRWRRSTKSSGGS
jgi:SAM-dependent methyltransferase